MNSDFGSRFGIAALLILVIITAGVFVYPDDSTQPLTEEAVVETSEPIHIDMSFIRYSGILAISKIPAKPNLNLEGKIFFEKFKPMLDEVTVPTVTMKMESIGNYWVTNYCPAECGGSWATSSGATCHRASYENRLTEPTTCAIDLSVNSYGDLFYIPAFDRVFVAEDTGSGVKGKWLDLFYVDYSDVVNFPVGYYEVYSVEYVYDEVPASYYDIRKYMKEPFEDALAEYNYEPWGEVNIIQINPTPFKKIVIIDVDIKDVEKKILEVPYL